MRVWAARGHGVVSAPRENSGRQHMAEGREPQQRGSVRPSKSPAEVLGMTGAPNQTGIHLPRYFPSTTASRRARKTPTTPKSGHAERRNPAAMLVSGLPLKPAWPRCLPDVLGAGSGWLALASGSSTAQTRTLLGRGGNTPFLMRVPDWDGLGVGRPDACGIADMTLASKSGGVAGWLGDWLAGWLDAKWVSIFIWRERDLLSATVEFCPGFWGSWRRSWL